MKKQFCTFCLEEFESELYEKNVKHIINNMSINYLEKYYICPKCNNKIYGDMFDYNVKAGNDELRKQTGLIRICEIEEIINKYSISQKNLSLILGFGEIQISRYLKSGNPSREHSDILKSVLNNPFVFEMYLVNSSDKISSFAYKKAINKVRELELSNIHSKVYGISSKVLELYDETSTLALQKELYFLNSLSKNFIDYNIFNEKVESWPKGPVYRDIYEAFSSFGNNPIDRTKIVPSDVILTPEEIDYIENMMKILSKYSPNALTNMSHLTDPWIKARVGLAPDEPSDRIIDEKDIEEYFDKVVKEYNINTYEDVEKYFDDLYKKTLE